MARPKRVFFCTDCGTEYAQWAGQCTACGSWNSLTEMISSTRTSTAKRASNLAPSSDIQTLGSVKSENIVRMHTGIPELDRVLGGGMVMGATILLGGDPGIGKSTLLLQAAAWLSNDAPTLYVSGEESAAQVALRARRLQTPASAVRLLAETQLERILDAIEREKPRVVIIDSIQTIYSENVQSAPGSVAQVRETAAQLVRYTKHHEITLFLVGHVTKEGALAGPRVLEHMVDAVLYFEGDSSSRYRIVRAFKNRFGAVNEIGVFLMEAGGLIEVSNPSAMFVSHQGDRVAGSVILATQEGTRPMLVEVQALVDDSQSANPRRVCVGIDANRIAMLLAVLHRHAGLPVSGQDVFINVAGGIRVSETASDLASLLAIVSSFRNQPLGRDLVIFGEVGLGGELRPVQRGQERLQEAAKLGFGRALIPHANKPKKPVEGVEILAARSLEEALGLVF